MRDIKEAYPSRDGRRRCLLMCRQNLLHTSSLHPCCFVNGTARHQVQMTFPGLAITLGRGEATDGVVLCGKAPDSSLENNRSLMNLKIEWKKVKNPSIDARKNLPPDQRNQESVKWRLKNVPGAAIQRSWCRAWLPPESDRSPKISKSNVARDSARSVATVNRWNWLGNLFSSCLRKSAVPNEQSEGDLKRKLDKWSKWRNQSEESK